VRKWLAEISKRLRQAARRWLGLEDIYMGVDFGYRDVSSVVIMSKTGTGIIKVVECRFGNIMEVEQLAKELQMRYGISERNTFEDYPAWYRNFRRLPRSNSDG
jgi:hypothetical protein